MKSEKSRRQPSGDKKRNTGAKPAPKRRVSKTDDKSPWRFKSADSDETENRPKSKRLKESSERPTVKKRSDAKRYSSSDDERPKRSISKFSKSGKTESSYTKSSRTSPDKKYRTKDEYTDRPKKIIKKKASKADGVRLNKFIANSGICSRREADEFIEAGVVTVNGVVVTELGTKVKPTDDVRFNGQRLQGEKKVYILLNKPKGYVTSVDDPHADKTVMDLIKGACSERVYPVGRLDKNTTGVLLFTNDGELTKQLTHPSNEKIKIYHAFLDKNVSQPDLEKLVEGFDLEDGFTQADSASYVDGQKSEVGLEIHSGRNRIVRRMFEHLGYKVTKLDRVYFAGLTKKGLKRGDWRILTPKEVNMLKMGAYK